MSILLLKPFSSSGDFPWIAVGPAFAPVCRRALYPGVRKWIQELCREKMQRGHQEMFPL